MSKKRIFAAITITLMALSLHPVPTFSQGSQANGQEIDALQVQGDWLDRIASELESRGVGLSDSEARELRIIHAQLRQFQGLRSASSPGQTGVNREEAEELQDRIASVWSGLRSKLKASKAAPAPGRTAPPSQPNETRSSAASETQSPRTVSTIPQGTRAIVRLTTWLSSKNAAVGDRFSAILADPILLEGREIVPRGAVFEGLVTDADRAGRAADAGKLQLLIDRLRGDQGQIADVRGVVVGTASGEDLKGDRVDVGKTAAIGAIGGVIGALVGGAKGALVGIGVGAGGTILADKGKDVDLPQGTLLRVEFQAPVSVTWSWRPMPSQ